jgi:hypothetical protein
VIRTAVFQSRHGRAKYCSLSHSEIAFCSVIRVEVGQSFSWRWSSLR